jgi:hypothetical protein
MNTVQLSQRFQAIERQIAEIKQALITAKIMEVPAPAPKPAESPFATEVQVSTRFRASVQHPFTIVASCACPSCNAKHEAVQFSIGENGGVVTTACSSCGQNLRVKLAWDANLK